MECRSSVHQAFHEKDLESSISVLPRVLSKIPTLLFVGDQDLICNYIGIENMIKALTWNGATGLGVCCVFPFRLQLILTVSSDCTDTIVECQLITCRHLGNFEKFDIRQGITRKLSAPFSSPTEYCLVRRKIFNASHMAPFDVPHVTHDMMLRFMGVNFSAIVDGSAKIPSSIGTDVKPIFGKTDAQSTSAVMPAKTPQQDKAMWEGTWSF